MDFFRKILVILGLVGNFFCGFWPINPCFAETGSGEVGSQLTDGACSSEKVLKFEFPPLEQTSAMRLETICMMKCLEEVHYSHKKLKSLDFDAILEEYMSQIDSSKMVFCQSEVDHIKKRFASTLDIFLNGGSLTPGFTIFDLFRSKLLERANWIYTVIDSPQLDLLGDEVFMLDRSEENWPKDSNGLDLLWRQRLCFELINEILIQDMPKIFQGEGPLEMFFRINKHYLEGLELDRGGIEPLVARDCAQALIEGKCPEENYFWYDVKDWRKRLKCLWDEVYVLRKKPFDVNDDKSYKVRSFDEKLLIAKENVKNRYKNLLKNVQQLDAWVIQEQFLNSISKNYDPHTIFMSKETMEELRMALHNSFVGIGAYLSDENGNCTIKELIPGGPAAKSRAILVGDKIISIQQEGEDPIEVPGMLLNKIVKMLRGKRGTTVTIVLQSSGGDVSNLKKVVLTRDEIELTDSRASAKFFKIKANGRKYRIGSIILPSFYGANEKELNSNSASDVAKLICQLKAKNVQGLILDLRNNGGGLLEESVLISGLFLEGPVVQVRGQYGNIDRLDTENSHAVWTGPLMVLTSKMSASAAEILAGALKDHNRAIIVGDKATHGKGTVQALLPMEQLFSKFKYKETLGASKITIQKWYRPNGDSTQLRGVEADIDLPSFDSLFPIGESDLAHALSWDQIKPISFERFKEITPRKIEVLKNKSLERQRTLPEFKLLSKRIDQMKKTLDKKEYSLNLKVRRQEKDDSEQFQKKVDDQMRKFVEKSYLAEDIVLDGLEVSKKKKPVLGEPEEPRIDTHLQETLRIMMDFLDK